MMLSPLLAKYWLLKVENLTDCTLERCFFRVASTDLYPWLEMRRVSTTFTRVSLDPVAMRC